MSAFDDWFQPESGMDRNKIVTLKPQRAVFERRCPECGYIMTQLQIQLANFHVCPRCEQSALADFVARNT